MLRVDATPLTALVVNGMALGNLLPRRLLVDVTVSIDRRGSLLLHAISLTHSTGPQNMLISVEIDRLESWTHLKIISHTDIVPRRYS